ncbi:MAG: poly(R)-hydroxyalkanoic acid synthase subunit PhaE [Desulfosalsimonadaceae bacterium]
MEESSGKSFDPATWFNLWMKSAGDMWNAMPQPGQTGFATPKSEGSDSGHAGKWMDAQVLTWQSLASAMSHPNTLSAYLQGLTRLPESLISLILPALTAAAEIHQKGMGQMGKAGDFLLSFNLENPDKYALDLWRSLYDQEFRKFLNIPQLGLTRQYQEKTNRIMDRLNLLQAAMTEFLHLLYLPFEKTQAAYSKKLAEDAEKNELPTDVKSQYMIWLKILEGHYMTLFKTPEYLESLNKTISAVADYSLAKKSLTDDLLKVLSIPSSDALDSVYKELYHMKERLKDLEKTIKTTIQR